MGVARDKVSPAPRNHNLHPAATRLSPRVTILWPWYYTVNSAKGFLDRIRVPTLIIHALDDPWIPATAYRSMDWNANPCLTPLLPEHGGHVGFHDGQAETWTDQCLVRFLGAGPGGLPSSQPA
jgi:pimeloyl-ACP methyl ester carboxylesterase